MNTRTSTLHAARRAALWGAAAALMLAPTSSLFAQGTFTISRVVDTSYPFPSFSGFNGAPAIEGGIVAFRGYNLTTGVSGIYANIGGGGAIAKLVDTATSVPGGTGTFSGGILGNSIDVYERPFGFGAAVEVAFQAYDAAGKEGIYVASGGGIVAKVLGVTTNNPDGSGPFRGFSIPSRDAGMTAFVASDNNFQPGVYQWGTTFTELADLNTPIPNGTGTFTSFAGGSGVVSTSDGSVYFHGAGAGQQGIYKSEGGVLTAIVDRNTAIPGGTTNFGFLDVASLSTDGGDVIFKAQDTTPAQREGIYKFADGVLSRVADRTTVAPGGISTFSNFGGSPAIDNGHVAFVEVTGPTFGLYTDLSGTLTRVIKTGDSLDGRVVSQVELGGEGLDGLSLAFRATFTNGTQGIYVAQLNDSVRDDVGGIAGTIAEVNGGISATGGAVIDFGTSLQTPGTVSAHYSTPDSGDFLSEYGATNGFDDVVANFLVASDGGPQQIWDVDFSGQFAGPVTLMLHYDESLLAPYFQTYESELGVYHYGLYGPGNERSWRFHGAGDSDFQIDTVNNLITLTLTSFSPIIPGAAPVAGGGSVPEPSSLAIFAGAFAGLFGIRRRRRGASRCGLFVRCGGRRAVASGIALLLLAIGVPARGDFVYGVWGTVAVRLPQDDNLALPPDIPDLVVQQSKGSDIAPVQGSPVSLNTSGEALGGTATVSATLTPRQIRAFASAAAGQRFVDSGFDLTVVDTMFMDLSGHPELIDPGNPFEIPMTFTFSADGRLDAGSVDGFAPSVANLSVQELTSSTTIFDGTASSWEGGVPSVPFHEIVGVPLVASLAVSDSHQYALTYQLNATGNVNAGNAAGGRIGADHTMALSRITFANGMTPEELGIQLTFASGLASPNLDGSQPVPEPGTLALLAAGSLTLGGVALRRRRNMGARPAEREA